MAVEGPSVPDVLVLGAGGVVGEAWMSGVLAGLRDGGGVDVRRAELVVGTSAGAIVAAGLAAGRVGRRPVGGGSGGGLGGGGGAGAGIARHGSESEEGPGGGSVGGAAPTRLRGIAAAVDPRARSSRSAGAGWAAPALVSGVAGRALGAGRAVADAVAAVTSPFAPAALAVGAPGGALVRARLLAQVPMGRRSLDELRASVVASGARFDGRLRIVAVDQASGRRVVFGAPGAPGASVADAVCASCAVPWIFAPVLICGRAYVDGGVWSLTNLDVAHVGRGTQVLCLSVAASLPLALGSPLGALRAVASAAEAIETQALRRRGARVRTIGPDAASAAAIGADLMDAGRAEGALAAGYEQGLATAPA